MFKLFIYIKYHFYFILLVSYIVYIYNYYKFNNNLLEKHIINCHILIKKSGCLMIKVAQNINKFIDFINTNDDKSLKFINIIFKDLYENCDIHSFNYTEKMFEKEFNKDIKKNFYIFKDIKNIKSGSIAQIYKAKPKKNSIFYKHNYNYAIKVVHPEIDIQMNYLLVYVKIYDFFYRRFYFTGTIFNLLDINLLYKTLSIQNDMNNEYKNLEYFYNQYIDNSYICIPTPIKSSKNILIMEFIDAIDIDSANTTINNQNKTHTLIHVLIGFFKENCMFLDKLHADLHEFNWKIKSDDFEKLVIFDYGFIVDVKSIFYNNQLYKNLIKNIFLAIDCADYELFIDNIWYFVKTNEKLNLKEKFIHFSKNFNFKSNKNSIIEGLMLFSKNNDFHLHEIILNIILMILNLKKFIDSYIYPSVSNSDMLLFHYITQRNFFLENKIFSNISKIIDDCYINNPKFIMTLEKKINFEKIYQENNNNFNNNSYDI